MMPGLYIYDGSCTFRKDNIPKVRKQHLLSQTWTKMDKYISK